MADSHEKFGVYLCGVVECTNFNKYNVAACDDLLNKGADINFKNPFDDDNTPLHIAIKRQNVDWICYLIKAGASSTVINRHGISAKDAATKNPKLVMALNRYKKINKNYLKVIDYTAAETDNFLELQDDIKILRIENASSFQNVKLLLTSKAFLRIFSNTNLFMLIFDIDDCDQTNDILNLITNSFKSPMVVQFCSKKTSYLYFNESNGIFKKLSIQKDLNPNELQSQISKSETIDMQILCDTLNSSDECFGRFNHDIMKIEIDMHKKIRGDLVTDLAITKSDLLALKFLNLFDLKFSCEVNSDIIANSILYGNLEELKQILGFLFSDEKSFRKSKLNELLDENFLLIAVQSGKLDIVRFFLENNCNVNAIDDSGLGASDYALVNKNFKMLHELLLFDSPFPKNFNENFRSLFSIEDSKFKALINSRAMFHKNIEENHIDKIRDFIMENPNLKHAYTKENQCALTTALKAKHFEIYSLLRSERFSQGIDQKCTQMLKNLNIHEREEVELKNRKYFECSDSNHLQKLIARSFLGCGSSQENFRKIRKYYITLNSISEVQPILKVVANNSKLKIIFDFNLGSVCDMDPTQISDHVIVRGKTIYCAGNVLIGAKQSEDQVLATLAHELTHLAMHDLYGNNGLPYKKDDSAQKEKFEDVAEKTFYIRSENQVIADAFDYEDDHIHPELIARVPRVCAELKNNIVKLGKFKSMFYNLFRYYKNSVLEDCNTLLPVMKSQQSIANLNQILSVYSKCQNFRWYSDKHVPYTDEIFSKKSNLHIETNHPELFLASVVKSQKNSVLLLKSHLFIEVAQLCDQKSFDMIKHAFHSEMKPKLFVIQDKLTDPYQTHFQDVKIVKDLDIKSNVVLVSTSRLNHLEFFGKEISLQYNWNDLCNESKSKFFEEEINFQGKQIFLKELILNADFLDEIPIQELLNLNNWNLNQNLDDHQIFYIYTSFKNVDRNNYVIKMLAENLYHELLNRKTIILADEGKTSVAIYLSRMFMRNEREYWVAFIDLKRYTNFFNTGRLNDQNYKEVLATMLSRGQIQKKLFHHLFMSKRVICIVDGYDEISPLYSKFVQNLVKTVQYHGNILMVTTRQHYTTELTEELGIGAINLQAFTDSDQRSLVKFWSQHSSKTESALFIDADVLLKQFHESVGLENLDLFGYPMLIRMIAEIFDDINPKKPQNFQLNIYELYDEFYKMKTLLMFDKGSLVQSNIVEGSKKIDVLGIHHKFAMETYFPRYLTASLNLPVVPDPQDKICETIRRIGLLNVSIGRDGFTGDWMHHTFVEYFVADYLLASVVKQNSETEREALYKLLYEVLSSSYSRRVRKFINDRMECTALGNEYNILTELLFQTSPLRREGKIICNLLEENLISCFAYIMNSLNMDQRFTILTQKGSMQDVPFITSCQHRGNFAKWWPIIKKFLDEENRKKLLFHYDEGMFFSFISTVMSFGDIHDIQSYLEELLKFFSVVDVKGILTGCFVENAGLPLHSILASTEPTIIYKFWEIAVQLPFPNEEDQKEILLARGYGNERILCEGLLNASNEGLDFLVKMIEHYLSPEEITTCLLDDHDQSFSLQLIAKFRKLDMFNFIWNFIETTLNVAQKKLVFMHTTKIEKNNVLYSCVQNEQDVRVTERVFEIARNFLTANEFKLCLRKGKKSYFSYQSYWASFRQFKILLEAIRKHLDGEELKIYFLDLICFHTRICFLFNGAENLKKRSLLFEISKSCFSGNKILLIFDKDIKKTFNETTSRDGILKFLEARPKLNKKRMKILPWKEQRSEKRLHSILKYGSADFIFKTFQNIDKSDLPTLLREKDDSGFEALEQSLFNNDKSAADCLWRLYNEVFSLDQILELLLKNAHTHICLQSIDVPRSKIILLAAITDHPFLLTALNFLTNYSPNEFKQVFTERKLLDVTNLVAKFCGEQVMSEYLIFIFNALEIDELKFMFLEKSHYQAKILSFLLENESVECFKLFWSKISPILTVPELIKIIPFDLITKRTNEASLSELKSILTDISKREKVFELYISIMNNRSSFFYGFLS